MCWMQTGKARSPSRRVESCIRCIAVSCTWWRKSRTTREFWCRGYYVDTVGKNTAKIQDYIKHQLEEDKMGEQLSIPYPGSPFTGRK